MNKRPVKKNFEELTKARITDTREVVISRSLTTGNYVMSPLVTFMEGDREVKRFERSALDVQSLEYVKNLRDALNVVLDKEGYYDGEPQANTIADDENWGEPTPEVETTAPAGIPMPKNDNFERAEKQFSEMQEQAEGKAPFVYVADDETLSKIPAPILDKAINEGLISEDIKSVALEAGIVDEDAPEELARGKFVEVQEDVASDSSAAEEVAEEIMDAVDILNELLNDGDITAEEYSNLAVIDSTEDVTKESIMKMVKEQRRAYKPKWMQGTGTNVVNETAEDRWELEEDETLEEDEWADL